MTLLCDREIRALCGTKDNLGRPNYSMIDPFVEDLVEDGVVSYGLTSCGYDFRAGNEWFVFTSNNGELWDPEDLPEGETEPVRTRSGAYVIDPKQRLPRHAYKRWLVPDNDCVIIPPRGYALTHSKEYVRMPRNVNGKCLGKSTYARVGIHLNVTPLEPGWEGQVTIELANSTEHAIKVYAGEGIMQVQFEKIAAPDKSYEDRKGKYQGQTGVTPHRVRGT
jgi:dCTP deaminase